MSGGIERRYARALMRLSSYNVDVGRKRLSQLQGIGQLFEMESANQVLTSPVMPQDLKRKLLHYAAEKSGVAGDKDLMQFLDAIVEARRIPLLPGIILVFAKLLDEQEGIVKAQVTSAVALDKKDLGLVEEILKSHFSKTSKVELREQVDPSILGGMVLRLGNSVVDLSVKTKLDQLAKSARA